MIVPNVATLRFDAGAVKFTRLNRLKTSRRNSARLSPLTLICLIAARSNCVKFGPRTLLRGAFPNGWLGSVGTDTHEGLNQLVIDCWPFGGTDRS